MARIVFADGTAWTWDDIDKKGFSFKGGDGDDTVTGYGGNDALFGGGGSDRLYGKGGDDTLTGGEGRDWMDGGEGNDTYVWNPGDENDVIEDSDDTGILQFGEGVRPEDVSASLRDGGVVLTVGTSGESGAEIGRASCRERV